MKQYINQSLFSQSDLDSGSLTMLGQVVHQFQVPGEYLGTVFKKNNFYGEFHLTVEEVSTSTQVNIDFSNIRSNNNENCACNKHSGMKHFTVSPKGYVLFFVSHGQGEFSVRVGQTANSRGKEEIFDSRQLNSGDIFVLTLIRPGNYFMLNTQTEGKGSITVAYPTGKEYRASYEPQEISCSNYFNPDQVEIGSSQGIIFKIQTKSRIKIEFQEPSNKDNDDGSEKKRRIKQKFDPRFVRHSKS